VGTNNSPSKEDKTIHNYSNSVDTKEKEVVQNQRKIPAQPIKKASKVD
jgi:hypothetical protein